MLLKCVFAKYAAPHDSGVLRAAYGYFTHHFSVACLIVKAETQHSLANRVSRKNRFPLGLFRLRIATCVEIAAFSESNKTKYHSDCSVFVTKTAAKIKGYQQLTLFRCRLARGGAEKLKIQLFGPQIASRRASRRFAGERFLGGEARLEARWESMYSNGRSETRFERERAVFQPLKLLTVNDNH